MKNTKNNSFKMPREKAMKYGIKNLDDYELLAIILRTGSRDLSILELSKELVSSLPSLKFLSNMTIQELTNYKGMGLAKALGILAAIELGKRSIMDNKEKVILRKTIDIYNYVKPMLCNLKQETLLAIYMNNKGCVEDVKIISIGTMTSTPIDPRVIIGWALKYSCFNIAIAHNHPSGDSMPSLADDECTSSLIFACKNMNIALFDHLIIGENEYYSYSLASKFYIEE